MCYKGGIGDQQIAPHAGQGDLAAFREDRQEEKHLHSVS